MTMTSLMISALCSLVVIVYVTNAESYDEDVPPIKPKSCYQTCAEEHDACVKRACKMLAVRREQWCHDTCLYFQSLCFEEC
ncbi:hypothetical protein NP493_1209g00053 [Ridgeia piscesae]|uniref:Uncharacterized protein n=1 Tax=Ridgeia piscesae TaxID=27915 RepID=A0AAD9KE04_RIDPI|nr:hypothetical protein NP493_1209g00053 [Ridgeia piscesae]